MKPDAILFDMDGVLVDTLDSWWKALNEAIKYYNKEEITRDFFIKYYWGRDLGNNLEKHGLNLKIIDLCNKEYDKYVSFTKIYPDVAQTLEQLKNYKKAVVTNTPKNSAIKVINHINLDKFFDVIVSADEVSMGKPSPEILIKACNVLNVNPKKVVLVGDTKADIEAAKAAGCNIIGVKIDTDYRIEKLSELANIIEI